MERIRRGVAQEGCDVCEEGAAFWRERETAMGVEWRGSKGGAALNLLRSKCWQWSPMCV